jgi:predicted dehydrogenase
MASVLLAADTHPVKLVIVDPGHFHASLLQKEMDPSTSPRVSVYAPLGSELLDYLNRIANFNNRAANPTRWEMEIRTGPNPMEQMLRDKAGNVVLFTGRNRGKIDRILASLDSGMNVLADKPWIIASADMPKLARALDLADRKGLIGYDIMTERFEITSILQRELVNEKAVFGEQDKGTAADPGIRAHSIHHVMKMVAGLPLQRPVWFFDVNEYGEALSDVGTHVVDLVQWTAFPDQPLDYRKDVSVLAGKHWPLVLTQAQFQQVTGKPQFPDSLAPWIRDGKLEYSCNNSVEYTLRGVHVKLDILWNWEAPAGAGDVYEAKFRGSKASVEIRQAAVPELYVVSAATAVRAEVLASLQQKIAALQKQWPGVGVEDRGSDFRIVIPDKYRVGHEAHFTQVANRFYSFMKSPKMLPAWEKSHMLVKYYISTKGVELSQAPR